MKKTIAQWTIRVGSEIRIGCLQAVAENDMQMVEGRAVSQGRGGVNVSQEMTLENTITYLRDRIFFAERYAAETKTELEWSLTQSFGHFYYDVKEKGTENYIVSVSLGKPFQKADVDRLTRTYLFSKAVDGLSLDRLVTEIMSLTTYEEVHEDEVAVIAWTPDGIKAIVTKAHDATLQPIMLIEHLCTETREVVYKELAELLFAKIEEFRSDQ